MSGQLAIFECGYVKRRMNNSVVTLYEAIPDEAELRFISTHQMKELGPANVLIYPTQRTMLLNHKTRCKIMGHFESEYDCGLVYVKQEAWEI